MAKHKKPPPMSDAELKAKLQAVTDPREALGLICEHSHMFYGDSYYRDLINALMDMASRLSEEPK